MSTVRGSVRLPKCINNTPFRWEERTSDILEIKQWRFVIIAVLDFTDHHCSSLVCHLMYEFVFVGVNNPAIPYSLQYIVLVCVMARNLL